MHSESRYEQIFSSTIVFSLALIILGFIMDTPANILSGLYRIVTMQDLLITDYVYIAGAGAALVNAGIVTMLFRYFSPLELSAVFAVLLMNALAPVFDIACEHFLSPQKGGSAS